MDDILWHRCDFPWWPLVRGQDGRLFLIEHNGKLWRRRVNGRWQYSQDDQTFDEWESTII